MNLGLAGAVLPLFLSTLKGVPSQQWSILSYTSSYMKTVNQFICQTKALPKLPTEIFTLIKSLGIAKHRRGVRSGVKFKHRQHSQDLHISTRVSTPVNTLRPLSRSEPNNLIYAKQTERISGHNNPSGLPSYLLLNTRSLFSKLDELSAILTTIPVDLVAITESWLHDGIDESLLSINGFNIFRKDRSTGRGGGVCVYLKEQIPCVRRLDLENPNYECLWLWLRPTRLPRPLSGIAVCVVYHPPGRNAQEHRDLIQYLTTSADTVRNKYPDCGLVLTGDFNDLDVTGLTSSHNLKQLVQHPTRQMAILDLIISNLDKFYETPVVSAPLGSSDHNSVRWAPKSKDSLDRSSASLRKRLVRRYPKSSIDAFGRWATSHDWFKDLGSNSDADTLGTSFTSQLSSAIDRYFPLKSIKQVNSDKPWITPSIKLLIKERQKAFHSGDVSLWRPLKSKVKTEIAKRKKDYYQNKVQHLKKTNCRKWWSAVNNISGRSRKTTSFALQRDGRSLGQQEVVNSLNDFYISVNADIPPLDVDSLPAFLPSCEPAPSVECYDVCKKLQSINPSKAHGPDNIPGRVLKEFAYELAAPVTMIFNASLASGVVPSVWKVSNITPIPKINPPMSEGDIRPISLTPCLSKTLEDYVVSWIIDDVKENIDPNQFGCLKGTSTTYCLLDMLHVWLSHLDSPGKHLRICFLDFSKAFDRIGYNVLISKLINIGVRRSLIPWIINFLSRRRQCVKLGEFTSHWLPINAGVPQGTKLGPILFLIMINNLSITTPDTKTWKYVDDVSISEGLSRDSTSYAQSSLDSISTWSTQNWMKLNAKKCKELRVCFFKEKPHLQPLLIDGQELECVTSHKVLGLTFQSNLKWNEHVNNIVSKASKRLYILRVLRRGSLPAEDLFTIYVAIVRSILEYCCAVWHHAIPLYLSEDIERIQKRAFRIILPGYHYKDALKILDCPLLSERRKQLCLGTIQKIAKGGPLSKHLPVRRADAHRHNTRNSNSFSLLQCRTERFRSSFFPSSIELLNRTK